MKSFASEVNCRIMVYEKPTAILAWLLGGEAFRELLVDYLFSSFAEIFSIRHARRSC